MIFKNCEKPLEYDVLNHKSGKVLIPVGTIGVKIAYRQAPWTFINDRGKVQRGNVYKFNGKLYY